MEKIVWESRKSRKAFLMSYILAGLLLATGAIFVLGVVNQFLPVVSDFSLYISAFFVMAGIIIILASEFKRTLVKYSITGTRIIREEGLFNKKIDYIPYQMIEKISSTHKWYERLLKTGSIEVNTGEENFWIESVDHPEKVEEIINRTIGKMARYQNDYNRPPRQNYRGNPR